MAQGHIYVVDPDGGLRHMAPAAPESEDRMQYLVARYPALISDGDGDLLLIRREQSISDSEGSDGRWSLDHLFVTRDAVPVLVELKRAVDTRLRREIVGQMLDYAANATAYWQAGRIADSFAATAAQTGLDAETVLADFIGDREPPGFWSQVDANFKAGKIKLVFVADEIPPELARVVEFLNDQMDADVRAVELRWFAGDGGLITLSPRVIGETERAAAAKGMAARLEPITCEQWLQKHIAPMGEAALDGGRSYVAIIEKLRGKTDFASRQASICAGFRGADGRTFYPIHLWSGGTVSLSFRWLHVRPSLRDENKRKKLLDELVSIVGPLTTTNLRGFPSFKVNLLAEPEIAAKVEVWLSGALDRMK